jgi:hypothetical protein
MHNNDDARKLLNQGFRLDSGNVEIIEGLQINDSN